MLVVRDARPGDAEAIATVQVATWRSTYRGIIPDNFLDAMEVEPRAAQWREVIAGRAGGPFVLVLEDPVRADPAGRVVGFAAAGPERTGDPEFRGELGAIYILPEYQGRGGGRQLVREVARRLLAQGMTGLLVWVLAANPYRRFYEALGGRQVRSRYIAIGGRQLEEWGYGWHDLRTLAGDTASPAGESSAAVGKGGGAPAPGGAGASVLKERTWRLLDTGFGPAAWNMAVDEAVQLAHARGQVPPTLRFFGWDPPAVSIGYFQRMAAEVDLDACRRLGYGWVRRPTGGRAIFHHMELTYSAVIREELLPGSVLATCAFLSRGLVAGLRRLGAPAEPAAGERDPRLAGAAGPACFDAPGAYEVVVGGRKVVGSAQTRKEGAILQHGSILLDLDPELLFTLLRVPPEQKAAAIEHLRRRAVGLREVLGRPVTWAEARDAVAAGFAEALGVHLVPGELTPEERAEAERLVREKYGTDGWNLRR